MVQTCISVFVTACMNVCAHQIHFWSCFRKDYRPSKVLRGRSRSFKVGSRIPGFNNVKFRSPPGIGRTRLNITMCWNHFWILQSMGVIFLVILSNAIIFLIRATRILGRTDLDRKMGRFLEPNLDNQHQVFHCHNSKDHFLPKATKPIAFLQQVKFQILL